MTRVLLVASDECIRATCCEVLRSLGFDAEASGDIEGSLRADILVLWEPTPEEVARARAARVAAAVVALTWDHRRAWDGVDAVVPLPFHSARIAHVLATLGRTPPTEHRARRAALGAAFQADAGAVQAA